MPDLFTTTIIFKVNTTSYQIKLDQFEGPFDLLLFFIERDELDIYNIPITKITNEFLDFIHSSEKESAKLKMQMEFTPVKLSYPLNKMAILIWLTYARH